MYMIQYNPKHPTVRRSYVLSEFYLSKYFTLAQVPEIEWAVLAGAHKKLVTRWDVEVRHSLT